MPSILSVLMELGKPSASCLTPETLGWGARALESPGSLSGFNGAAPCQLGEQGLPGLGRGQKIPESTTLCLSVSSVAWPSVQSGQWLVRHDYKTGKERRNAASKEPTRASLLTPICSLRSAPVRGCLGLTKRQRHASHPGLQAAEAQAVQLREPNMAVLTST